MRVTDDAGNHKFIGDAGSVGVLHCTNGIVAVVALSQNEGIIGLLHPFPTVIAVHRIVASHHRSDFAEVQLGELCLKLGYVILAGGRRNVPSVEEAVNINLREAVFLCHLQKSEQMLDMAVNTAVGHKAHQVEGGAVFAAVFHRAGQRFVLEEITVLNGFGDAGQLLIDHPSGADIGVSDLGVAHLAVRQTDIQTGGSQLGVRVLCEITVEVGFMGGMDGVSIIGMVDAEAVQNH